MTSRTPPGSAYKHPVCLRHNNSRPVGVRIEGINPADLTRQINAIQMQLLDLAKAKTEALSAALHIDLEASQPSPRAHFYVRHVAPTAPVIATIRGRVAGLTLTCSRFPGRLVLGVHAAVLVVV